MLFKDFKFIFILTFATVFNSLLGMDKVQKQTSIPLDKIVELAQTNNIQISTNEALNCMLVTIDDMTYNVGELKKNKDGKSEVTLCSGELDLINSTLSKENKIKIESKPLGPISSFEEELAKIIDAAVSPAKESLGAIVNKHRQQSQKDLEECNRKQTAYLELINKTAEQNTQEIAKSTNANETGTPEDILKQLEQISGLIQTYADKNIEIPQEVLPLCLKNQEILGEIEESLKEVRDTKSSKELEQELHIDHAVNQEKLSQGIKEMEAVIVDMDIIQEIQDIKKDIKNDFQGIKDHLNKASNLANTISSQIHSLNSLPPFPAPVIVNPNPVQNNVINPKSSKNIPYKEIIIGAGAAGIIIAACYAIWKKIKSQQENNEKRVKLK